MIINELHLGVIQEKRLDQQREAEKVRLIRQIATLQKGESPLSKIAVRYACQALTTLAIIGLGVIEVIVRATERIE
jgi:hypothetical protein